VIAQAAAVAARSIYRVPGDHGSLMLVPTNAEVVARELRAVLDD
jgi:hypothetical protein